MTRSYGLVAVGSLLLGACGGGDVATNTEVPEASGPSAQWTDNRYWVTGDYFVTGMMYFTENGQTEAAETEDIVIITPEGPPPGLNVAILSFDECGPPAMLIGQRSFLVLPGSCTVNPEPGCSLTMDFNGGWGYLDTNDVLNLTLGSVLTGDCGRGPVVIDVYSELSGPPVEDPALSGPQAQARAAKSGTATLLRRVKTGGP